MRDRLRLQNLDLGSRGKPERAREVLPFPGEGSNGPRGVLRDEAITNAPFQSWRPRDAGDSIANAESALAHVERQMANLRALMGMDAPEGDDPRAA